ncbi:MAG: bifunctional proline dehydrogenase/L-glutamate gamma-semialdehyde dehydrogenase [Micavibrio aeruginosavorus]|uniref:L-glutamate gamma-semialdehyde dehydrogenase n=1 Tax=Micavibrio aeruginosavorus TaxID=349221 RepID=A0A2W5PTZ5_9BACT|nr:MAG: bifunctional proline dehydrogenase/L-glutamate gamma-semialdehyde dehydrogenase [Micavibrio aeruginosavorus]
MARDYFQSLPRYLAMPEKECVDGLVSALDWDGGRAQRVSQKTIEMIEAMRGAKRRSGSIESFFQTYSLSTQEGLALMSLAEALLRVPDAATANNLIRDKIARTKWIKEGGAVDDWMLRMAGMGLSVSKATLNGPLSRLGEPVIRKAMQEGMKLLGGQFVLGQKIDEALKNAAVLTAEKNYLFSYDMLGEGARTMEDAEAYFKLYEDAIEAIGQARGRGDAPAPGISVKLSALHPRYSAAQEEYCLPALIAKLSVLCRKAANYNICLTVDAEEADRLEISLKIVRAMAEDITLTGWEGFGLAVQAYSKRALPLIEGLIALAQDSGRRIQIRLVKGAYWDAEIKRAQVKGLDDYPVFTRKRHTDLSYLACAQKLLRAREYVYPMFGTHNAHTVQAILDMDSGSRNGFEFQRLFGMGDALYDRLLETEKPSVRIYAPVGVHRDLLPYLVRRLLENGANSSFVGKVFDPMVMPQMLAGDPLEEVLEQGGGPHPSIPLPRNIFMDRLNSRGVDLDDAQTLQSLLQQMDEAFEARGLICASLIDGRSAPTGIGVDITSPSDYMHKIGTAYYANEDLADQAFAAAEAGFSAWSRTSSSHRASILNKIADLYQDNEALLLSLCVNEAGKTLSDAVAEVREAVDFCRYYAAVGEADFHENGRNLSTYTGESNKIMLQGRGTFVCISPWNFPLAIFTGQIAAALMAGNAVVAKPAEQTPFIALEAVRLMHKAGVPAGALQLLIGDGRVGEIIVQHKNVAGIAFTGSTGAAFSINRALAAKDGPIAPFIAETGGQNAIIVDSSALIEQVVDDVVLSAFGSAGQRCSAARVLFVQQEIADKTIKMLQGAMAELKLGNPQIYSTDIGPLIDEEALATLQQHKSTLEGIGKFIAQAPLSEELRKQGHYFAPIAFEINGLSDLKKEIFGPALHIIRYQAGQLPAVIREINGSGYGLTFGYHTRVDAAAAKAIQEIAAGNVYINRSITGAVVGVQPFGGNGLSGTGPKAGGPYYLHRFAVEKTVSINTTAAGGNTSLVMLDD